MEAPPPVPIPPPAPPPTPPAPGSRAETRLAALSGPAAGRRPQHGPWPRMAALRLLHPGPSLLVSACFVAAAAAARHALPSLPTVIRLAGVMLPMQFAIGALNDLCDQDLDRMAGKPKPLVDGDASPAAAVAITILGFSLSAVAAASFPLPALLLALVAGLAGASYDVGLKRGALSWLPWWVGFSALPLCAWAAAGQPVLRLLAAVPALALALSLSLHLANALPDIGADHRHGSRGLAVRLGPVWCRRLSLGLAGAAGAGAILAAPLLGQDPRWVLVGALPLLLGSAVLAVRRSRRCFPVLAVGAGILAAVWLVALP